MSDQKQRYRNILNAALGSTWAIMPSKLDAIIDFLSLQSAGVKFTAEEIELRAGPDRARRLKQVRGSVAVLPLYGLISQKVNMMTDISGGTSTEMFGAAFDDAVANKDIKAIVFDIDSPGGTVNGVPELADKIHRARGSKQIVAVTNSLMASGAYWIGSAADQIVITPSGEAGSIGVYGMHEDWSKYNEESGVRPTYISAGKYKVEGNPDAPLSVEARAFLQSTVDEIYGLFTGDVARFRGTTQNRVQNGYGEGRCLSATKAVEAGLADRIGTLERVLGELGAGPLPPAGKRAEGEGVEIVAEDEPTSEGADELEDRRRRWRNTKRKMGL